jgi:hypothetical protein
MCARPDLFRFEAEKLFFLGVHRKPRLCGAVLNPAYIPDWLLDEEVPKT